jgi:hypothetical protein
VIQAGIFAVLAAATGVTGLVGQRFFEADAPDDLAQYPCISMSLVGGSSAPTLSTSGTVRQRVELNGFALDYPTADAIRSAIIAALNGWQETLGDGTNVLETELLNPGTDFVSEQRIFRCLVEFYVLYTLPT